MRVRIWTEHSTRVLPTMDGPMQVHPGDVVVVAVVSDEAAARTVLERLSLVTDRPPVRCRE